MRHSLGKRHGLGVQVSGHQLFVEVDGRKSGEVRHGSAQELLSVTLPPTEELCGETDEEQVNACVR